MAMVLDHPRPRGRWPGGPTTIAVMYAGQVVEQAPTARRSSPTCRMPYTEALLESIPEVDAAEPHAGCQASPGARPTSIAAGRVPVRAALSVRAADGVTAEAPPLRRGRRTGTRTAAGSRSARPARHAAPARAPATPRGRRRGTQRSTAARRAVSGRPDERPAPALVTADGRLADRAPAIADALLLRSSTSSVEFPSRGTAPSTRCPTSAFDVAPARRSGSSASRAAASRRPGGRSCSSPAHRRSGAVRRGRPDQLERRGAAPRSHRASR